MRPRLRPGTATFAVLDCFLLLGLLGLYLKIGMLDLQWEAIARFLGKLKAYEVSPLQRLGFYFDDIVVNLILVPLLATPIVCVLFRRYRAGAAALLCIALGTVYFFELRAQAEVGQYVSRDLVMDSLRWSIANPGMGSEYITVASAIKLGIVLAAWVAIWILARLARRVERVGPLHDSPWYRRLLMLPAISIPALAVVVAALSLAHRLPDSLLNPSSVGRVARMLLGPGADQGSTGHLDFNQALAASRQLTHSAALDSANPLIGSERDADVLVFIMETGPAQALDFAASGRELPGIGPLFERSFVAQRHYTTYPYTSDAVYSMLSGLYPQGRRRLFRNLQHASLNGLMSALKDSVPVRRVYLPSLYHAEVDDRMYAAFGAETLYASDEHADDPLHATGEQRADELLAQLERSGSVFDAASRELLHARLAADFQALEKMKADIADAVHTHRRYCVAYLPQVAHAPWTALHSESTVLARGRALMLLQDMWVKELVDLLRDLGRLDHTVIAVTADHGIRTRAEDPALAIGKISDYMFRVPLLIYAPDALQQTSLIDSPTSHIDIAPTLLALLGATGSAARMQGIPVWQRGTHDRLYFWAANYGGADGFEQDGSYYMRQALSGSVFESSTFTFGDDTLARRDDPAIAFATDALTQARQLQETLVSRLIEAPGR
ncbi:MAG: sulfatase-like hydrolase/transferase [Lysobacterales bacterium]